MIIDCGGQFLRMLVSFILFFFPKENLKGFGLVKAAF